MNKQLEQLCIDNIRMICLEMIDKAQSGHLGTPLGVAPLVHTLFSKYINISSKNPEWKNRDRFVLAGGHASSILYTMLHLAGYIKMEDLIEFRQLGSITTGHPEVGVCPGVDITTGPLGQGLGAAVGFAIGERFLNSQYPEYIDHLTYVMCGDGDIEEGVGQEALSLAGLQKLNKLIVLYDSNDVQIDGRASLVLKEDNKKKYEAMGFNYLLIKDGNNLDEINKVLKKAISFTKTTNKPTFIENRSIIGFGTSSENNSKAHGSMLPKGETQEIRKAFGGEEFTIDQSVYEFYKKTIIKRGNKKYKEWKKLDCPEGFKEFFDSSKIDYSKLPVVTTRETTRKEGSLILKELSNQYKGLIGGAADLGPSTFAIGNDGMNSSENPTGRNMLFGVREHAMGCIANALTAYGFRGFASTFFVFSDYLKDTIRTAAISHLPTLFIFSHDSIAVGEDGPTHQPIEQLTAMRSIPNTLTFRPCDGLETKVCYELAMKELKKPSVIVLTRQHLDYVTTENKDMYKGGYILSKEQGKLEGILIATGSEVSLALKAKELLGKGIRVVSMPCINLFDLQSKDYKDKVLPKNVKTLAIEMSDAVHFYKYTSNLLNIEKFGLSSKKDILIDTYGFNPENVARVFKEIKE